MSLNLHWHTLYAYKPSPCKKSTFWLGILISSALAQWRKREDRCVGAKILPNCSSFCQSSEWELLYAFSTSCVALHNTDEFRGISNKMGRQLLWSNYLHLFTELNFYYWKREEHNFSASIFISYRGIQMRVSHQENKAILTKDIAQPERLLDPHCKNAVFIS